MSLTVVTEPAVEPVSLSEAKAQLSINDALQDDIITRNIVSARQHAESYTTNAFITQTLKLTLDGFNAEDDQGVELPVLPVQSITQVQYIDGSGSLQTLDPADYELANTTSRHMIYPAIGEEWPATYERFNAVQVTLVAGYGNAADDVPEKIREAILLTVEHWVNNRIRTELGGSVLMVPRSVDQLLVPYKLMRF